MSLAQALQQSGVIDSMARELGIDSATAQKATNALLPAIVAGLGRNQFGAEGTRNSSGGLADVLGGLAGAADGGGAPGGGLGGLGGVLLDQVLGQQPTPAQPGNDILGQIFGSKEVSRGVAEEVAGSTGLSSDLLKKMLPILAMAVVGYMMKQHASSQQPAGNAGGGGVLGGALGGILGQVVTGMIRR